MTTDRHDDAGEPEATWNRGDGEPDRELLAKAIAAVRSECVPVRIVLFGSAARGELTDESDIDLLVVVGDFTLAKGGRNIAFRIRERIGYEPRADVLVKTESEVVEAAESLAGILRTASEDGVTVYEAGNVRPYRRRARRPPSDERVSPHKAQGEARRLLAGARSRLERAELFDKVSREVCHENETERTTCDLTEIAGAARKAVEFALQAVIVSTGRRPHAWKSPAGLAAEAAATGVTVPPTEPGALEQAAEHYAGPAYPDYPGPDEAETATALKTAQQLVGWAERILKDDGPDDGPDERR